jgi:hypothetical protein
MTPVGDHSADHVCRMNVISGEKAAAFPNPSHPLSPPCEILGTTSRERQSLNQG